MKLSKAIRLFREAKFGIDSKYTNRWYNSRLKPLLVFLGDVDIEEVTVFRLRNWRNDLPPKKWTRG